MIAKHVSMKSLKKSDFGILVKYLLDPQEKLERVGAISVTNCHADVPEFAITEVLNTQAQNKRAMSDKTYHLVVSFQTGEQPNDEILKAIETRLCAGIGYADHQRISVVHHDTDHLHVHIAINKIHPVRYTIHNPHNDHKLLGPLCEKLEREYGLAIDNHQPHKREPENRANDMEHQAGVESLLGWIKRECLEQMRSAQSWSALHDAMRANGLMLHERGNGLVISAAGGPTVKASSVGREFSKAKLLARFGPFEADLNSASALIQKFYQRAPMPSKHNTVELYARYKQDQLDAAARRTSEWAIARDRHRRSIEAAKRGGRLKRGAIKLIDSARVTKRLLFALAGTALRTDINNINQQYLKERQVIAAKNRRRTWADWLRARAHAGDEEALAALRARVPAAGVTGDVLSGRGRDHQGQRLPPDSITKQGTIIYCVGATVVRDRGDKLSVSRGTNDQLGLLFALQFAADRFGRNIAVGGTDEFKERIAREAAAASLDITFDDAALERRRRELLQRTTPTKEKHDEQKESSKQQRPGRGGAHSAGPAGTRAPAHGRGAGATGTVKPNIGRLGQCPPPTGKDGLRGLSQLGVVRIASGAEVLLPRDVRGHVEQQGTAADHRLRRPVSGPGLSSPLAAAQKYVFDREQKHADLFDIPKFASYDGFQGHANFAGIRKVDGHKLALIDCGGKIQVVPIDDATARRLQRTRLGTGVVVSSQGLIKTKGRSR